MPFVVGETIGPYRILEQLGRGGWLRYLKAFHAVLDRYVAIKALHPAFMEDPIEISLNTGDFAHAQKIRVELDSRDDVPEWVRAHLGFIMSNYDGNVDDLGEVKDKNQDDPWMHIEMLELRLSEGDYPGAEEEVRKIMVLGGENPEVNSETGDILARYEIWPYAAQFYMRSARLMTRPPSDIISKIQFTIY